MPNSDGFWSPLLSDDTLTVPEELVSLLLSLFDRLVRSLLGVLARLVDLLLDVLLNVLRLLLGLVNLLLDVPPNFLRLLLGVIDGLFGVVTADRGQHAASPDSSHYVMPSSPRVVMLRRPRGGPGSVVDGAVVLRRGTSVAG